MGLVRKGGADYMTIIRGARGVCVILEWEGGADYITANRGARGVCVGLEWEGEFEGGAFAGGGGHRDAASV